MQTHKFRVGQTVFIQPSLRLNFPGGPYIVTKKLPERDGDAQYRVRNINEPHERVVHESDLTNIT
jgi:hypothetical protein